MRPWVAAVFCALAAGCTPSVDGPEPLFAPDPRSDDPRIVARFEAARQAVRRAGDRAVSRGDRAEAAGEAAMLYHAYGFSRAAAAAYRLAAELDPGRFEWHYLLALTERDRGRDDAALAALGRALDLRPDDPSARLARAGVLLERNEAANALAAYRAVLDDRPDLPAALAGAGRAALAAGDPAAAADYLERALRAAPSASALHYPLGMAYRDLGHGERALELLARRGDTPLPVDDPYLSRVEALGDAGVVAVQNRGMELLRRGRVAEAVDAFRDAVAANPGDARLHANLGHGLMQAGGFEEALAAFDAALELDPGYVTALFNRGVALARLGRDDDAVEAYRAALDRDPALAAAHHNLGNALRRLGRPDEALASFAEVLRLQPTHAGARLSEAATLIDLRRFDAAAARLAEAGELLPDDRSLLHLRVRLLATSPDPTVRDGALARELGERLARGPVSLEEGVTLAMVSAENGDFETAVALVTRAIATLEEIDDARAAELRRQLEAQLASYRRRHPWRL